MTVRKLEDYRSYIESLADDEITSLLSPYIRTPVQHGQNIKVTTTVTRVHLIQEAKTALHYNVTAHSQGDWPPMLTRGC